MTKFAPKADMGSLREKLEEVYESDKLTSNEIEFIDSLTYWEGCFTEAQAGRLEGIHDRVA